MQSFATGHRYLSLVASGNQMKALKPTSSVAAGRSPAVVTGVRLPVPAPSNMCANVSRLTFPGLMRTYWLTYLANSRPFYIDLEAYDWPVWNWGWVIGVKVACTGWGGSLQTTPLVLGALNILRPEQNDCYIADDNSQMHLISMKLLYFEYNFIEVCSMGSNTQ